jgi:hypothetical protein
MGLFNALIDLVTAPVEIAIDVAASVVEKAGEIVEDLKK